MLIIHIVSEMHVFGARSLIWKKPIIWPILSGNGNAILHEMPCSKGKRMMIATFRDHYSAITILLNPLVFHCILPLNVPDLIELNTARFLIVTRQLHARWWCTNRCNNVALVPIVHVFFWGWPGDSTKKVLQNCLFWRCRRQRLKRPVETLRLASASYPFS
jgi:hypothetical protein